MLDCRGHKAVHHAVRIYEAIRGAEAAADNVVRAELRQHGANFVGGQQPGGGEPKFLLSFEVIAQISEMRVFSGEEKIALWAVIGGMADHFFKLRIEGN